MNQQALDSAWQSGYCRDIILQFKDSPEEASAERAAAIGKHLPTCRECEYANRLKNVEDRTARALGGRAVLDFEQGRRSKDPMFIQAFEREFKRAVQEGTISSSMFLWMARIAAERAGKAFPG